MKTYVTPYVLSEHESERLGSCEENEISIILGDDAYHNLRISLQHAKMLLAKGVYQRIYYINLPFSGKRFYADYKAAEIADDKRLSIFHVSSGYLAETIRDIRNQMHQHDEAGTTAIIINSWEMGSRSYRHREDLIFELYNMQMHSEATFFVYSVAEAKHIIMRRSSRAGFGRLVMISDELVDLSTGKYRIAKKEEVKVNRYEDEVEEEPVVSEAPLTEFKEEEHRVGENVVDRKINELAIEVGEEDKVEIWDEDEYEESVYKQAA